MLKNIFCIAQFCLLLPFVCQSAHAGVMVTDVSARDTNGSFIAYATAAHGYFDGNDTANQQNLLELLNNGTSNTSLNLTPSIDGTDIAISSTGMFSTDNSFGVGGNDSSGRKIVDLIDGTTVVNSGTDQWIYQGKSDDGNTPFVFNSGDGEGQGSNTGTLVLTTPPAPLSGNFVLSLKAGNQFSVYAFSDVQGVMRFEFTNLPFGLSHASLFTGSGVDLSPPPVVPEPTTFAIWTTMLSGLMFIRRRKS